MRIGGKKYEFRQAIDGSLRDEAVVQCVTSNATIEIQVIDPLTTESRKTTTKDNSAFSLRPAEDANALL